MISKKLAAAVGAGAAVLACGTAAFAQAPAAPPPITHGPPINGICIMSVEGAIGSSTVGKYVQGRLQQIAAQVNAELNGEKTAVDTEAHTLETQRSTMDQNTFEQRAAALQVRYNALQRRADLRNREVSATEQKAVTRVEDEMEPLIRAAYQQKACSLLLARTSVLVANPAMDITPAVVTALNAKITQFAFDREHLDQPATAAAGGAPPIVQTPSSSSTSTARSTGHK